VKLTTVAREALWYVDAPADLREQRLVERQVRGGRDVKAARDWVRHSDRPNGDLVKRSQGSADRTLIVG